MNLSLKTVAKKLALGLALTTMAPIAMADYPNHAIKLVVPYTPGGAGDMLGRLLSEHMGKSLNQPVVVENKPGASTRIAARMVARSAPDGYTLFLASNSSMVLNPLLYSSIEYDAKKDYDLIGVVAEMPLIVVTNGKVPANTLPEFISYAKDQKGKLNYASVGLGNPLQLATQLLISEGGMDITHIPYNGSAPALTSLVSNDTQLMIDGIITSLPFINDGRLKPLAVASSERLPVLPDVMTVSESAIPGYKAATWFGIALPAATPADRKEKLREAINAAIADEKIRGVMEAGGMVMQKPRTQEEINSYLESDRSQWETVIKENNIKLD